MPRDRFHEYLDYCDTVEIIGVGDYIETVARGETLAWTFLMRDLHDTYKAGKLKRVVAANGSAAYVRPDCAKLHPNGALHGAPGSNQQQEGISI